MEGVSKLFSGMRIAATGMSAERIRIDTVARNIANSTVTRTAEGGPYKRQVVEFEPILLRQADGRDVNAGVRVRGVTNDEISSFERIHDPGHPDADKNGWVTYPNVNATREMADLITAVRAYEANIDVQENFVRMADRALRLAQ
ncbi:MAG: flagellar basal body rod protein FlgC [Planctomycetes bacterium]|jgi:flagellar basal-body rod protein FlgC|nr:flagellar basal body rod protein FlgC [Planctomycetota bacterium]